MATTTTLNAHIKVRYDTATNWTTHNPILMSGEIAIVEVAAASGSTPATLLFKVGDGVNHYSNLGWGSALAADVYEWAKAATKPAYDYSEIASTPQMAYDAENETLVFSIKN